MSGSDPVTIEIALQGATLVALVAFLIRTTFTFGQIVKQQDTLVKSVDSHRKDFKEHKAENEEAHRTIRKEVADGRTDYAHLQAQVEAHLRNGK